MSAEQTGLRVFVMGCSRGGTTLSQRLIAEGLGLYTLPETRFFANMIGNLERRMFPATQRSGNWRRFSSSLREGLGLSTGQEYAGLAHMDVNQRHKWSSVSRISAEFVVLLDEEAAQADCTGWLEKTPFHVHYADKIQSLVPGAWMIHIIRDAQETVASLWDVVTRHPEAWRETYDRIERVVDNWNASIADSAAMVGAPRQIFVPYAALAAAPDEVVARIAERMKTPLTAQTGQRVAANLISMQQDWKSAAIDGPVRPAVSKWATALSQDEQSRAQALMRPVPDALQSAMAPFYALMTSAQAHP